MLPSATREAIGIIDWLANENIDILFSLMNQYTVMPNVTSKHLKRQVTDREYEKVQNHLLSKNLNGYLQAHSSATHTYIPTFDLEGV